MDVFRKIYPSEYFLKFLGLGVRPDGRKIDKERKTTITTGSIATADGSSFVKLGNTTVVAGVTAEIGKHTDISNSSHIIINVELTPLCSSRFRAGGPASSSVGTASSSTTPSGRPSEQAQACSHFLNNLIHSNAFVIKNDFKVVSAKQSSEDGADEVQYSWYLFVDIYCLNYDGNILDACLIALLAALKNVCLPNVINDGGFFVTEDNEKGNNTLTLDIVEYPISLTFGILDEYIIVDPTNEEEEQLASNFTIIYTNTGKLCSVFKPGGTAVLTEEQLKMSLQVAKRRASHIHNLLNPQTS
mmetsp:Transcript_9986/g.13717  ORF Transcript_9986/g.13717 Transcript_9986/m.13717 type:complete len:301 (+) Transcript_9986:29-931(+)